MTAGNASESRTADLSKLPRQSVPPAPYFDDGQTTIYCGDVLDVLPTLGAFDLIFTSPRYNLGVSPHGQFGHWKDGGNRGGAGKWKGVAEGGIGYDQSPDSTPPAVYQAWQQMVLALCWEHLSDVGAIFYNHKPRVQRDGLWSPLTLNPGLPIRQIITWDRGSGLNYTQTGYVPMYEWVVVIAKEAWRLRSKAASGAGDVWRIPPDSGNGHPAPFPVELPARAIETTAPTSVLDPFMGSGSALLAAQAQGVRSVGIDMSEAYCAMAVDRLAQGSLFGAAS